MVCVIAWDPRTQMGVGRADCLLWFALCWTAMVHVWLGMGIREYVIDAWQGGCRSVVVIHAWIGRGW